MHLYGSRHDTAQHCHKIPSTFHGRTAPDPISRTIIGMEHGAQITRVMTPSSWSGQVWWLNVCNECAGEGVYGVRQASAGPATNQYQTLPACRGATTALCHSDFPRCGLVSVVSPPRARANPLTVSWAASSARARPEERRVASRRLGGGMLGLRCVLCCHGVTVLCVDPVVTAPAAALSHQPRSSPARPATSLHSASVPATATSTTSHFYCAVASSGCLPDIIYRAMPMVQTMGPSCRTVDPATKCLWSLLFCNFLPFLCLSNAALMRNCIKSVSCLVKVWRHDIKSVSSENIAQYCRYCHSYSSYTPLTSVPQLQSEFPELASAGDTLTSVTVRQWPPARLRLTSSWQSDTERQTPDNLLFSHCPQHCVRVV